MPVILNNMRKYYMINQFVEAKGKKKLLKVKLIPGFNKISSSKLGHIKDNKFFKKLQEMKTKEGASYIVVNPSNAPKKKSKKDKKDK